MKYEKLVAQIIILNKEDVITTSTNVTTPIIPLLENPVLPCPEDLDVFNLAKTYVTSFDDSFS